MHELSIAEAMIETAIAAAHAAGGGRIVRLRVRVGELSGVDPDALSFAFPVVARGTPAEAAQLEVLRCEARIQCRRCGAPTSGELLNFRCAQCGCESAQIVDGRQLCLESLEIEAPVAPEQE